MTQKKKQQQQPPKRKREREREIRAQRDCMMLIQTRNVEMFDADDDDKRCDGGKGDDIVKSSIICTEFLTLAIH